MARNGLLFAPRSGQRRAFEEELDGVKQQLARQEVEAAEAAETVAAQLLDARREASIATHEAAAAAAALSVQVPKGGEGGVENRSPPQPPKATEAKKRTGHLLAHLDLDEGPDAPPGLSTHMHTATDIP